MRKIIGIDLGMTNSVCEVMLSGDPTVIPSSEGGWLFPSMVAVNPKTSDRMVGQVARRQAVVNPENTIFAINRLMGRRFDDPQVQRVMKFVPYRITAAPNGDVRVWMGGKEYSPPEISAMILQKIKTDAESYLGESVTQAVITVPAYFNDGQRQVTKDAGKLAGLKVLRIVAEPIASSLAYGLGKKKSGTIAVYDFGGGTFDISILDVANGVFEFKSTNGDVFLGGDDFDWRIINWVADEFMKNQGIDLRKDRLALQRLKEACEKAKVELSTVMETEINLPFITADAGGPKHLQVKLARAKLEQLVEDLIRRSIRPCKRALADARLTPRDIDEVVLAGGTTRMPAVQLAVHQFFGREPLKGVNPDEVVGIGAAILAGILGSEVKDVNIDFLRALDDTSTRVVPSGHLETAIPVPESAARPDRGAGRALDDASAQVFSPDRLKTTIPEPESAAKPDWDAGAVRQLLPDALDFELEIGLGSGREYPVAVLRSPGGEARETMIFPYKELELENKLVTLQNALLRSGGRLRRVLSPEAQAVQDFGQALFNALLTGEVRSRYDVSRQEAAQQGRGLRLKLRIRPPEMAALPWEFLYDPREAEYVCLSRDTPVVRYVEVPRPIQPLTVTPPLRVLGMVASPQDLIRLDVDQERQRVEEALKDLQAKGQVKLTWLPGQTWRDLQRAMRRGPWHVFHFIGHGGFNRVTDEGFIALADKQGKTVHFSATQLTRLLADHHSLRLVLLNACEGARGSDLDIFSSTAAILVRRGIPAVLAMQYDITDRVAIELAYTCYEALADGLPVDVAVAEARKAISMAVNNTVEWGTPVLYMRAPDGVLFKIQE